MDKLACMAFVLNSDTLEDRVKIAALADYFDAFDDDEAKLAAFQELESMSKEAFGAGWGKLLNRFGRMFAGGKGKGMQRFGNWLRGKGAKLYRGARSASKGASSSTGKAAGGLKSVTMKLDPSKGSIRERFRAMQEAAYQRGKDSGLGSSSLLNWAARHPTAGKLGLGGLVVGGSLVGGGLYGKIKANEAYKQGYGQATGQLSPMVSALYAPQGAMGVRA